MDSDLQSETSPSVAHLLANLVVIILPHKL